VEQGVTLTWGHIVSLVAMLGTTAMGIISFFLKRELDRQEKDLAKVDTRVEKLETKIETLKTEMQGKLDALKAEVLTKVEQAKVELRGAIDAFTRDSHVGDDRFLDELKAVEKDLLTELEKVKEAVQRADRDTLERFAGLNERFLSRVDFVRDNTMLDAKLSATAKSIRTVEASIDALLKGYVNDNHQKG
jgi:hypothetical protein